jgi:hypothetical protein
MKKERHTQGYREKETRTHRETQRDTERKSDARTGSGAAYSRMPRMRGLPPPAPPRFTCRHFAVMGVVGRSSTQPAVFTGSATASSGVSDRKSGELPENRLSFDGVFPLSRPPSTCTATSTMARGFEPAGTGSFDDSPAAFLPYSNVT